MYVISTLLQDMVQSYKLVVLGEGGVGKSGTEIYTHHHSSFFFSAVLTVCVCLCTRACSCMCVCMCECGLIEMVSLACCLIAEF